MTDIEKITVFEQGASTFRTVACTHPWCRAFPNQKSELLKEANLCSYIAERLGQGTITWDDRHDRYLEFVQENLRERPWEKKTA
jgi:hypothetical protein